MMNKFVNFLLFTHILTSNGRMLEELIPVPEDSKEPLRDPLPLPLPPPPPREDISEVCVDGKCQTPTPDICDYEFIKKLKNTTSCYEDDCVCDLMYITTLSRLECVIPEDIMGRLEDCRSEGMEVLRETQDTCRQGQCVIDHERIAEFERQIDHEKEDYDRETDYGKPKPLNQTLAPPVEIDYEPYEIGDMIVTCFRGCGYDEDDLCEIDVKVLRTNCTTTVDTCDLDQLKDQIYEKCEIGALGFGGFSSSASMIMGMMSILLVLAMN
jgi:hypothetical protein